MVHTAQDQTLRPLHLLFSLPRVLCLQADSCQLPYHFHVTSIKCHLSWAHPSPIYKIEASPTDCNLISLTCPDFFPLTNHTIFLTIMLPCYTIYFSLPLFIIYLCLQECKLHEGKDICLFCSLIYLKSLE